MGPKTQRGDKPVRCTRLGTESYSEFIAVVRKPLHRSPSENHLVGASAGRVLSALLRSMNRPKTSGRRSVNRPRHTKVRKPKSKRRLATLSWRPVRAGGKTTLVSDLLDQHMRGETAFGQTRNGLPYLVVMEDRGARSLEWALKRPYIAKDTFPYTCLNGDWLRVSSVPLLEQPIILDGMTCSTTRRTARTRAQT